MLKTGLFDKNGNEIEIGNIVKLVLNDGEERVFEVCWKTVTRTVKCHPDFDDDYAKVNITGVVFCWEGYELFPCVDENGISDVSKMEVIEAGNCGRCQREDAPCDDCIRNGENCEYDCLVDRYYHE